MRILIIADPFVPVPPSKYGGAERVISLYAQEFARLGHRVDLLAGTGSRDYGGSLHLHYPPSSTYQSRAYRKIRFQLQSLLAAHNCDAIYNHGRFDYLEALLAFKRPLLHNFHCPIDSHHIKLAESKMHANSAFQFISDSQRSQAIVTKPSFVIPNPVDSHYYEVGNGAGNYLVFLGRLTFNKGVDIAISVARQTGHRLIIAGNIPKNQASEIYFREHVQPHLDGHQICWVGSIGDKQKKQLLSQASALLFPIRGPEAFGLVMTEALACGCPVIATRREATPEVLDNGVTGWLCDPEEPSIDSFVEAVKHVHELDRQACRQAVEQRFDVRVLAPRVLEVLQQLIQRKTPAAKHERY